MNANNTLAILDSFSRELGKQGNVTKAVTEITTHSMFPSDVNLSVASRQLKLAQDGEIVLTLNYHSTTDLMARIIEACTLIRCRTPQEHMLNRMDCVKLNGAIHDIINLTQTNTRKGNHEHQHFYHPKN